MELENLFENLETMQKYFSQKEFHSEVMNARRDFFGETGDDSTDSQRFESKMNLFFDWYLLSRNFKNLELPPVKLLSQFEDISIKSNFLSESDTFSLVSHSLYECLKIKKEIILVKDLFLGTKYKVKAEDLYIGVSSGDVFETRIISNGKTFYFLKGFCFHPVYARKYFLQEIKNIKEKFNKEESSEFLKAKNLFLLKIFKMQIKLEKYKHLSVEDLYTNNSKVKF